MFFGWVCAVLPLWREPTLFSVSQQWRSAMDFWGLLIWIGIGALVFWLFTQAV
jgi:hypothetical protein